MRQVSVVPPEEQEDQQIQRSAGHHQPRGEALVHELALPGLSDHVIFTIPDWWLWVGGMESKGGFPFALKISMRHICQLLRGAVWADPRCSGLPLLASFGH